MFSHWERLCSISNLTDLKQFSNRTLQTSCNMSATIALFINHSVFWCIHQSLSHPLSSVLVVSNSWRRGFVNILENFVSRTHTNRALEALQCIEPATKMATFAQLFALNSFVSFDENILEERFREYFGDNFSCEKHKQGLHWVSNTKLNKFSSFDVDFR